MKTVCSSSMPFAEDAFRTLGDVTVHEGRGISARHVADADLLAIRSTTKVTRELLRNSHVRFVGSATIGTDHMDVEHLEAAGIHWCYSPGCNANSVAEYVVSALLCLALRHNLALSNKTLGIVGVGNVGKRVAQKARALGMQVLLNDPPRRRSEPEHADQFVELDHLLENADVVTVHVPLTHEGTDATHHLANTDFFARMRKQAIFMNAARGGVVDSAALMQALRGGHIQHAVIDTWEHEPSISLELLNAVDLGTPHIAGYSFEGKVMGTVMVYREACRFLGISPTWDHTACMPPPVVPVVELTDGTTPTLEALAQAVHRVYDITDDDRALRACPARDAETVARHFDSLRTNYPIRREFRYTRIQASDLSPATQTALSQLEFQVAASQLA